MDILSLCVSFAGLLISLWAAYDSQNSKRVSQEAKQESQEAKQDAERAVESVVRRSDRDEDRARLQNLGEILRQAEAVARTYSSSDDLKRAGSGDLKRAGLRDSQSDDIQLLQAAQNALRTGFPLSADPDAEAKALVAAAEIARCVSGIEDPDSNRDGWKDAWLVIQYTIRDCDKLAQSLRGDALAGV